MIFRHIIIILTGTAIIFFSCISNKNSSGKIKFENITRTNIFGAETGNVDTSDWRFNDNWTEIENGLFADTDYIQACGLNVYYRILAYPNPFEDMVVLNLCKDERTLIRLGIFDLDENLTFKYRLVDKDFNIIASVDSFINNSSSVNFKVSLFNNPDNTDSVYLNKTVSTDTLFRIYYQLIDADNKCVYKGHGDVMIKK